MSESEITYFHLLKQEISQQLRSAFPEVDEKIECWKGKDIRYFQDDLIRHVNGRVSEKWFYTHIKSEHDQLPRIDMLDMLSQYVGFRNWEHFKSEQQNNLHKTRTFYQARPSFLWIGTSSVLIMLVAYYLYAQQNQHYQFCFVNAYNQEAIQDASLSIILLDPTESPYKITTNQKGCIQFSSNRQEVRFVVKGPYYQTDTIVRKLDKQDSFELVPLKTNDFAWMIKVFSQAKVNDWNLRRIQLDSMFREDARIYQIFEHEQIGMEMFNKWDFINKLSMPISSLQNIEILDMQYEGERIKTLRFKQIQEEPNE